MLQPSSQSGSRTAFPQASLFDRRQAVGQAALAATLILSQSASALSDLTMNDLDVGGGSSVAVSVGDLSASEAEPIKIGVVTLEAGQKKPKKDTPASRIKELQSKGSLTDKEKKVCGRPDNMPYDPQCIASHDFGSCTCACFFCDMQELRQLKADEMCEMLGRGC